ncbi:MAG: TonB-dependent receptor [Bryobacterales bacterium]|nr:TonB-dependent receptor [Bryobacterales bacterium]
MNTFHTAILHLLFPPFRYAQVGFATLLAALLFCPAASLAQSAALSGRVLDASGAAVPDAELHANRKSTNFSLTVSSSQDGSYVFASLPADEYELTVAADGFKTLVRPVRLPTAGRVREDFTLSVGERADRIVVESRFELVERDTAAVSTVFDGEFVQNMPLNGRTFQTLLELTPGVSMARSNLSNPGQFTINGQRTNANVFMVDGVSANFVASPIATYAQQASGSIPAFTLQGGTNSLVSLEELQEFRVQTSSYSSEFGRSPGGQIQMTTRSGTNELHGALYHYFRNEKLDANDWFANEIAQPRPALRSNNFGGAISGPVFLPKFYDGRNRTFFFANYEGLRLLQPQPTVPNLLVPSAEARAQATGAVADVLRAFPLPNAPLLPGDVQDPRLGRYTYTFSNPNEFNKLSGRVDQNLSDNVHLFFRFANTPSSERSRVFANQFNSFRIDNRFFTGGKTWSISPRLVSDLRMNYSRSQGRFNFEAEEIDGAILPPDSLIFPSNLPRDRTSVSLQLVAFPNTLSLTQGRSIGNSQRQFNLLETFSVVAGAHTVKFGFDWRRLMPIAEFRELGVSYNFTTRTGGIGIIDLLETGRVNVSAQALAPVTDFRIHNFSAFVDDTWRIHPKLTLTLGARWEVNPAPSGERLPYTLADTNNLLGTDLAPPGTRMYRTRRANIAPRVGIAWSPLAGSDLVIRTGAGLFYDVGNGQALGGYTGFPFNSNTALPGQQWPVDPALIVPAPFNANPPYNATFRVVDPNIHLPATWHWNFSAEKGLGRDQSITMGYVGSRSLRLLRNDLLRNRASVISTIRPVINPEVFHPNATVFLNRNAGDANYHSLQTSYQRRMSKGVQAMAAYTWSKSIDNSSDEVTGLLPVEGIPGIPYNLRQERGLSDFDTPHLLSAAISWELASPRSGVAKALLGGWALDGVGRIRSGLPLTVIAPQVDDLNFASSRRVDYLGGDVWLDDANVAGGRRLNAAAFAIPQPDIQGTLGRNAIRGFTVRQLDLSIRRNFTITDTSRLEFRGDLFNITNTPNFGLPPASLTVPENPLFGVARSSFGRFLGSGGSSGGLNPLFQVGGPRSVQLSLRLVF